MANLQLIAKGGLVVLIVISLAVLIERLTNKFSVDNLSIEENQLLTNTTSLPTVDIVETIFNENFSKCLAEHSKSYYYAINKTSSSCHPLGKCMHSFLIELSQLMASFTINLKLLEPDLLFCLLPSSRKFNLLTRGFTSNRVLGSRNVITFGIFESEAKVLEETSTRMKLISSGYRILRFPRLINSGNGIGDNAEFYHYFIIKDDLLIHLIVLYSRASYLWSPGLNTAEIELKGLQYVNDRLFENFTVSSVHLDTLSMAEVFLPSDTRCFLLDMMTSNFLECKAVPSSTITKVNDDVLAALKHLKALLASHMVSFWLWSKTLQGWFEKCDVLHYTDKLKFSVAAKSVEGFNFTALFTSSNCQHIETTLNLNSNIKSVKIKCEEVPIELIFMYEENITYWYEYVDKHNTYKLNFPKFSLCSTDIYGQKIAVPCETDEIFEGEYGQFLKNTTLHLDPETMKNIQLVDSS